jgi:hypothetical protein
MVVQPPTDALALGLMALAVALSDERRAKRFLDLTGIGTDELRDNASEPALLAALIRFLESYEPDLVAVAEGVGIEPAKLVKARKQLEEIEKE